MRQNVRIASDFIGIVIDIIASHSLFFHLLNWNIVDLQCCVSFRYITSWFSLYIYICMCVCSVAQWYLTLCDPMGCNMPGLSVHRIFQARILEWVAISSCRVSSWPKDQTHVSCISCNGRQILHHWATWEASLYTHRHTHTHTHIFRFFSVFSSAAQSCPTMCDPMSCSTPGFPVPRYLPEFAQTHVLSQSCHRTISSSVT